MATKQSIPEGHHLAAVLHKAGTPPSVETRPTPKPGPGDLLIEVHSIALNPVDGYMRDAGFNLETWPTVLGSDIAGRVISAGPDVDTTKPWAKPGARVAAFAIVFYTKGNPDYGAYQKRVLVPTSSVTPLPDSVSFNEGALLPMAVGTSWGAWYTADIPRDVQHTLADKQGILIWGGASSIGSAGVQLARSQGFHVYVTASRKHHEYLKSLGATRLFDYHDADVVSQIVKAAKEDGVTVQVGYDAVGSVKECVEVLQQVKGDGAARLAAAVPSVRSPYPDVDDVIIKFSMPPSGEEARREFASFAYNVWLKEKLEKGEFVPSPRVKVVEGGLGGVNKALDELKAGVSGVKLVLEV